MIDISKLVPEIDETWFEDTDHVLKDQVRKLEQQFRETIKTLLEMISELKLSNDNNELAIDGRHMNIYMAWMEAEKYIESLDPSGRSFEEIMEVITDGK
jgi:hypothetical protein